MQYTGGDIVRCLIPGNALNITQFKLYTVTAYADAEHSGFPDKDAIRILDDANEIQWFTADRFELVQGVSSSSEGNWMPDQYYFRVSAAAMVRVFTDIRADDQADALRLAEYVDWQAKVTDGDYDTFVVEKVWG